MLNEIGLSMQGIINEINKSEKTKLSYSVARHFLSEFMADIGQYLMKLLPKESVMDQHLLVELQVKINQVMAKVLQEIYLCESPKE